jgi:Tfp pilus assembly protein PilN
MIRVNLLKNLGSSVSTSAGANFNLTGLSISPMGSADQNELIKLAVIKVLAMLALVFVLKGYEFYNLANLKGQVAQTQAEAEAVKKKIASFGDVAQSIQKFTEQETQIEKRLGVIRDIAKNRLREVKTLDNLQSMIPNRTWIKQLILDNGKVSLSGYSDSEQDVTDLMKNISSSALFSSVYPKSNSLEEKAGSSLRHFELEFKLGRGE